MAGAPQKRLLDHFPVLESKLERPTYPLCFDLVFAYGCNLGPTYRPARSITDHLIRPAGSPLAQPAARHRKSALRAGHCAGINAYNPLTGCPPDMGTWPAGCADGTKWNLYEQNLSIGNTKHTAFTVATGAGAATTTSPTNTFALFSHFIPCGVVMRPVTSLTALIKKRIPISPGHLAWR